MLKHDFIVVLFFKAKEIMQKEKEIIKWLKKNNQPDNSFSDKEYKNGLSLFCQNSKNRVLIHNLSGKKILQRHKSSLHYNLTKILTRHIENNNLLAVSINSSNESSKKTSEKKKVDKSTTPKVTVREMLKPDSLVKLQAKGNDLFTKSAVQHRELVDKYFSKDEISNEEKKEIEPIVIEIVAATNENITIHQELEYYVKTGQILGQHPDLIAVDYSALTDDDLFKKIKTVMSNISNYSTKLKTAKGENKVKISLKIQELKQKKATLIAERDRRKK
jgi:hypothetical protein